MPDEFAPFTPDFNAQAGGAEAVNLASTDYTPATNGNSSRALYISGAGDVKVDMLITGTAITFSAVPAGSILPIRISKIYKTGTTATGIVNLW